MRPSARHSSANARQALRTSTANGTSLRTRDKDGAEARQDGGPSGNDGDEEEKGEDDPDAGDGAADCAVTTTPTVVSQASISGSLSDGDRQKQATTVAAAAATKTTTMPVGDHDAAWELTRSGKRNRDFSVGTWDEVDADTQKAAEASKRRQLHCEQLLLAKRQLSEWDKNIDRGHVKKVKTVEDEYISSNYSTDGKSPFQTVLDNYR